MKSFLTGLRNLPQLLSLFFMLLKASNNLLYLAVLTTFLEKAGAASLPWVYLLVNLLFIVVQFRVMTRISGREGHWLLSVAIWPSIALSAAAAVFMPIHSAPVLIGFLIFAMQLDLITNQAFTAMLNQFPQCQGFAPGVAGYICCRQFWLHSERPDA
jgi:hypothetical protein